MDQYEIIGLRKILHSMKQPCSSICLKKALAKQCSTLAKQTENRIFDLQTAFKISSLTQILSAGLPACHKTWFY